MAGKFVLTAEIRMRAPKNLKKVAQQIRSNLGSKTTEVKVQVKGAKKTAADLARVEKAVEKAGSKASAARGKFDLLGSAIGQAVVHVARYDVARRIVTAFGQAIGRATKDAIAFEREIIKVSQVTGQSVQSLKFLNTEITRLATNFGVSSSSLVKTTRILAQAGLTAKQTKSALEALAKTTLAPTFDDITSTTETSIAVMSQFGLEASKLENVLGKINRVAGSFAVEAGDLGTAIKRAGGVFKSAGGSVEELIALFTSVRSTTRETAETIATGFRTIFTRLQRPTTLKFLKRFGVELQNLEGQFVGPFEAVRRLNAVLKDLDPRDIRYSQITEQLGGFRQVSKVIPLIQQFEKAQKAYNVALDGGASLSKDAQTAQQGLAVQFTKVREEFTALVRAISNDSVFRGMIELATNMAKAFIRVADSIKPLIPLLTAFGTFALARGVGRVALGRGGGGGRGACGRGGAMPGIIGVNKGGKIKGYARGGLVPGRGNADTVPAMLQPGEFVIRKSAVQSHGVSNLAGINRYNKGTKNRGVPKRGKKKPGTIQSQQRLGMLVQKVGKADPPDYTKVSASLRSAKQRGPVKRLLAQDETARVQAPVDVSIFTKGGNSFENSEKAIRKRAKNAQRNLSRSAGRSIGNAYKAKLGLSLGQLFEDYVTTTAGVKKPGNKNFDLIKKEGQLKDFVNERIRPYTDIKLSSNSTNARDVIRKGINQKRFDRSINRRAQRLEATNKKNTGGVITTGFAAGGAVDTVPALLTPGEFVINKESSQKIGYSKLNAMNKYSRGGPVQKRANGGPILKFAEGTPGRGVPGGAMGQAAIRRNEEAAARKANKGLDDAGKAGKKASRDLLGMAFVVSALTESLASGEGVFNDFMGGVSQGILTFVLLNEVISASALARGFDNLRGGTEGAGKGLGTLAGGLIAGAFAVNAFADKLVAADIKAGGAARQGAAGKAAGFGVAAGAIGGAGVGLGAAAGVAAATGTALTSTGIGALIGIPLLIGALAFGASEYSAATKAIQKADFADSVSKLDDTFQRFSKGRISTGLALAQAGTGSRDLRRVIERDPSQRGEFAGEIKKITGKTKELVLEFAKTSKTTQEFDNATRGAIREATLLGQTSFRRLREEAHKQIEAQIKAREAQAKLSQQIEDTFKTLNLQRSLAAGFREMTARVQEASRGLEVFATLATGRLSIGKPRAIGRLLQKPEEIVDFDKFKREIEAVDDKLKEMQVPLEDITKISGPAKKAGEVLTKLPAVLLGSAKAHRQQRRAKVLLIRFLSNWD